jgi:hypothetical protein
MKKIITWIRKRTLIEKISIFGIVSGLYWLIAWDFIFSTNWHTKKLQIDEHALIFLIIMQFVFLLLVFGGKKSN